MTERFTSDLVFIVIVLGVAAVLGYIIGYLSKKHKHLLDCKALEDEIARLNTRLDDCHRENQSLISKISFYIGMSFNAKAAASALGKEISYNDLKIVEGIGEKIESILKDHGIDTWFNLSQSDPNRIKEILLDAGGPTYSMHEPKTWPKQALLMCDGKWAELKEYQDILIGGK